MNLIEKIIRNFSFTTICETYKKIMIKAKIILDYLFLMTRLKPFEIMKPFCVIFVKYIEN